MRSAILCVLSLVGVMFLSAAPGAQQPAEPTQLPVRRVVLYKSGVGFFEHLGNVTGSSDIAIQFTSGQLDDALKSLTALDLDRGAISAISYNSVAPLDQQLAALRLPLGDNPDTLRLYEALRGTRVELRLRSGLATGRILSVERRERRRDGGTTEPVEIVTIVGDDGAVRSVPIDADVTVRIDERDVRGELGRYLSVIASGRGQDVRRMVISATGQGTRRLLVSYISEVPVWKSTYRLVLPENTSEKPLLQGWAIVDNTVGEDWTNVELSLVAGAPQSFIQQISQPLYARRPVVPLPSTVQRTPQTHEATLEERADAKVAEAITVTGATPFLPGRGGGVVGGVVGGLNEAPAAASARPQAADVLAAQRSVTVAAASQDLGDLFEYRLSQPVTIRKNQSALVPILSASVDAERLSLWRGAPGNGRPLRAIWLTNSTSLTLDGGTFSVIEANAFAGEGLVDPLKPNEKRLVSYGTDLALVVDARLGESSGRYTRVTARDGVMIAQQEDRNQWVYRVRNEDTSPRTLVIEHAIRAGWTLAPTPAPAETTPTAARFRVPVGSKGEATLTINERRVVDTRYSLDQVDERTITTITSRGGVVPDALRQALQPVIDKRAEVAAADREVNELNNQIKTIGDDQQRVRQNMQVLKGTAEEKALLKRYTTELNEQEDRLSTLRKQVTDATGRRDARRAELSQLIQRLTFTLDAPAGA